MPLQPEKEGSSPSGLHSLAGAPLDPGCPVLTLRGAEVALWDWKLGEATILPQDRYDVASSETALLTGMIKGHTGEPLALPSAREDCQC